MAKELGVTCGSVQGKFVEKIKEMEERDKKEQSDWEIGEVQHEYHHIQCQKAREGGQMAINQKNVKNEHIDMICIQEPKKEVIEKSMCQALWGDS